VKRLPILRGAGISAHQGGWDEILLYVGAPVTLFIVLRWLGVRRERREQREQQASSDD
jgi:hypothetical protein